MIWIRRSEICPLVEWAAADQLAETVPTTAAGVFAMLQHVQDAIEKESSFHELRAVDVDAVRLTCKGCQHWPPRAPDPDHVVAGLLPGEHAGRRAWPMAAGRRQEARLG